MDITNQTELELYFADHFDTILFPVLAEIYQSKAEYDRAKRVCEIGLEHHPNSVEGQFILSQAEMALGNLIVAEKWLKKVLDMVPTHQPAAAALPVLQEQLGRSKNTLTDSWKRAQDVDPSNQFATDFLSPKTTKNKKDKEAIPADIMIEKASISPRLATFTLVHVLKGQGLYQRALDVLDILDQKGENKKQIEVERQSIQSLL
ncbi:MAG: hypothetical protein VYA83_03905 [Candidatus Neomarinimicrobiota bacterium]|jgi:tetratricopeptide (TPR) repeat protein|nr:hypothetical protein [Candidatus Neomarinimicrobiota bacterium]MEC7872749.1 hypothetical protein [Candidatus Neomarinimicrobiota bacterium]MEC9006518.1 hypothetical protein [Candidatus Neomarinimicrobiota bacterium]MEC9437405.1 hypothetical protein [Candidatus Neomarinimicrobiota bacterium]MEC9475104.1 hypothetical protein [Candidatus Neomarinimicrobiota bacterium]|tara:strand:+ start:1180 stop:1791 length:612 start_codon:yes stop_codon:yes gene_type:complete